MTAPRIPTPDEVNAMVTASFPGSGDRCAALGPGFGLAKRVVAADDLRPGGYISGPTQFGLADAALWYLVFATTGRIDPMALTAELSIRYLRPAVGDVLWARAGLDAAGRRNVIGTVRVWVDDRESEPTAVAQGTYILSA